MTSATTSGGTGTAVYTPEMRLREVAARLQRTGQRLRVSGAADFPLLGASDLDERESRYVGEALAAALAAADLRRSVGECVAADLRRVAGLRNVACADLRGYVEVAGSATSHVQLSDLLARRLGDLVHHVLDVVPEPPPPPRPRRDLVATATVVPTRYRDPSDREGWLVFRLGGEVEHRVQLNWVRGDDPLVVMRRFGDVSDDRPIEVVLEPPHVAEDYVLGVGLVELRK